jgi:hypothetical protein
MNAGDELEVYQKGNLEFDYFAKFVGISPDYNSDLGCYFIVEAEGNFYEVPMGQCKKRVTE